ncbi:MAG: flagellar hook-associated protein FlgL [Dehalococcoidales bacterium]|nr:flagellar hook-associated protein FlgL [Dehalococcoidales bacterium]
MRITHNMLSDTTLRNLNKNMERLDRLQDELTSGQRIGAPSDDPIGAAAAVQFRGTLDEIDQFIRNADAADSWLGATDSAFDAVTSTLQRARELAVQGGNDTLSPSDKQKAAYEVSQLLDQAIALGNSTYAGQFLFAGYKVSTAPFSPVGSPPTSVTYNGDAGQISRQIDNQSTVIVNTPGSTAFPQIFSALIGLRDDLNIGNSSAISARITDLDNAIDSVVAARSQIGARMNRLDSQKDRLESLKVNITQMLSKTQDVDMTEAITEFAMQQDIYKAALAAGSKAIQPSLLDYLR